MPLRLPCNTLHLALTLAPTHRGYALTLRHTTPIACHVPQTPTAMAPALVHPASAARPRHSRDLVLRFRNNVMVMQPPLRSYIGHLRGPCGVPRSLLTT